MSKIRLYYNGDCNKCVKRTMRTKKFDWLNNIDLSSEAPKSGQLRAGEISIHEYSSNDWFTGVEATRKLCMNVPIYYLFGLLLYLPFIKIMAELFTKRKKSN